MRARRRAHQNRRLLPQRLQQRRIHVVGMRVRDHDEVGFRNAAVVCLAPRIDVNDLAVELQHHAAVKKGCDFEGALRRFYDVRLMVGYSRAKGQRNASQEQNAQVSRTHVRILSQMEFPSVYNGKIWNAWHTEKYRRRNTKTLDCCD